MPLYQPKIPVCVAIGCSGVALVFQLVAVAGTGWMMTSDISGSSGSGLFCSEGGCSFDIEDWIKGCQAFSILALGTIVGSLVLGVLHIFKEDTQKLILPARACNIAAAVCVAVEVGVYLAKTLKFVISASGNLYGYGFYLSIVAGVLSTVSAALYRPSVNSSLIAPG